MAKQTKTIYVVEEDDGSGDGCKVQTIHTNIEDAFYSAEGEAVEVEIYKLVRKVKVTRTEQFHEEEI